MPQCKENQFSISPFGKRKLWSTSAKVILTAHPQPPFQGYGPNPASPKSRIFYLNFVTLRWGFLLILFALQFWVLIIKYNINKQWTKITPEKIILSLSLNPGLALPGFRTINEQPSLTVSLVHNYKKLTTMFILSSATSSDLMFTN